MKKLESRKLIKKKESDEMQRKIIFGICFIFMFVMIGSLVAKEQTVDPVIVTEHFYKENAKLKYPQVDRLSSQKVKEKLNKGFQTYIEKSAKEWADIQKDAEEHNYTADYQTDFEVRYNQAPFLSIVTSNYKYTGGAHGNTIVESFNYHIENGKRIYLTDILVDEEQIKSVQNFVWEYAIERPEIFYPDLKKEDVLLTKDTAFYFNDTGITLLFQQYEIAPYASGNQEIVVPEALYD